MNYSVNYLYYLVFVFGVIFAYSVNRLVDLYSQLEGNFWWRLNHALDLLPQELLTHPGKFAFHPLPLWSATLSFIFLWLLYYYWQSSQQHSHHGREHGSAHWGSKRDIRPYINSNAEQNIILSESERLNFATVKNFNYQRNHNVLVIGGSGSGKTYSYLKPNLMQLHSSYVVTDPKGTIIGDTGYLFTKSGYQVKVFDTVNFARSLRYNPLAYLRDEADILKLTNVIILNTKGEGRVGDDFWLKAEQLWLSACIGYLYYQAPKKDCHLGSLLDLLSIAGASESDENYQSPLDLMFADLAAKQPDCFPVRQYQKYKLSAGTTAKSILISLAARLAVFDLDSVRNLLATDELGLDKLGDSKQVLFVIISDTDPTYHFLSAMLFYQAFDLLCSKADGLPGGHLKLPVRFLLDEFANLGVLPHFDKTISTMRSRGLSANIIVQSLSQLQALYPKQSEVIIDCCDSVVFLGGKSLKTTKDISTMIGRATIAHQSISQTQGQGGTFTKSEQIIARSLLDQSEIAALPREECLVLISGLPPFRSKKYNPAHHRRWKLLADSNGVPPFVFQTNGEGQFKKIKLMD